jgi:hypothetical protein
MAAAKCLVWNSLYGIGMTHINSALLQPAGVFKRSPRKYFELAREESWNKAPYNHKINTNALRISGFCL